MSSIERLRDFEQIKLLADPRRLKVLRQLMAAPASLTQVGKAIGEHPAWVRHHLKLLEQAGLVEMVESRVTSGVVENFYLARAGGLLLQELILPETTGRPTVVFSGSHDLAVELLAKLLKGAVGASRPACDNGWVKDIMQIGLTGKIVSPDVYIAVAVSGTTQHLAGCSGARNIIAINKDPDANIFTEARFGVVGDWKKVLPGFEAEVKKLMGK